MTGISILSFLGVVLITRIDHNNQQKTLSQLHRDDTLT